MIRLGAVVFALALSAAAHAQSAVVALIPGSGFNGAKASYVGRMTFTPDVWQGPGYETVPVPYRRGKAGLKDVLAGVRLVDSRHPDLPLCLYGESSGGAWALQAAVRTGVVDCLIVVAGVTDQETLARSPFRLARHLGARIWPRYFGPAKADGYFEPYDLWAGGAPDVPTLLAYGETDRVVPAQQGELLAGVAPAAELRVLRPGPRRFAHGRANASDFVRAREAAVALVEAQTTSP